MKALVLFLPQESPLKNSWTTGNLSKKNLFLKTNSKLTTVAILYRIRHPKNKILQIKAPQIFLEVKPALYTFHCF